MLSHLNYLAEMSNSPDFTEEQHAAMKDILVGWGDLSRGDISIICANWRTPGQIKTIDGTPHARFWRNLVRIGWAEQIYSLIDPGTVPFEPLGFRLTDHGHAHLPRFLMFYDLLNMGACAPAIDKEAFLKANDIPKIESPISTLFPTSIRIIPSLSLVLAGLWLAYNRANPFLCFFLITYSAIVALLAQADLYKAPMGKFLRVMGNLNAAVLGIGIVPLLFR